MPKVVKQENIISQDIVENKIFLIRKQKVIIDRDLAVLYGVTTGNLNKAVKRNIERFPNDFMFQLSVLESKNLMFQFGISSWGGTRKSPYVFTEQGIAMLSGILKSKKAVEVNIAIMRIFVNIRKFVSTYEGLAMKISELENKYDNKIIDIYKVLDKFNKDESDKIEIGFKC